MPLQEFWYENPDLLWAYRTSFVNKEKIRSDEIDYQAWLIGFYTQHAIASFFGAKKNTYPSKPLTITKTRDIGKSLELKIKAQLSRGQEILKQGEK